MTTTEIVKAAAIAFALLPAVGAQLEGGIFCGITTTKDGAHVAVVLLADTTEDKSWADAKAWAESVGGELPTRPVAAMLFANAKSHFEPSWHWTSEEAGASYAWGCGFNDGYQLSNDKSYEGCARAVRLIPLVA
jgi:hypothetical protein